MGGETDPAREGRTASTRSRQQELAFTLLRAAYDGDLEGVAAALKKGAPLDAADGPTGLTVLHIAVGTNNLPMVRYLIEERGAPFGPDKFGRWPTLVAAECGVDDELGDYIAEKEAEHLARNRSVTKN